MEYDRIDKVQTGVISPSKLRLKLLGPHNHKKKKGGRNSSRTSPSKLEDLEYVKNSLLAAKADEFDTEGDPNNSHPHGSNTALEVQTSHHQGVRETKETKDTTLVKGHIYFNSNGYQVQGGTNSSTIHPEDNTDYDSGYDNASSSSFEFHKGERPLQNSMLGPFSRPIPSKWYDAEKWVSTKQILYPSLPKKNLLQSQVNRQSVANYVRVAPEAVYLDQRTNPMVITDAKQIPMNCNPRPQGGFEKFSFAGSISSPGLDKGVIGSGDQTVFSDEVSSLARDRQQANHISDIPCVRSVEMRDMGTEMTPMTSQEPSRTGTPLGSTPIRSPATSLPSTPRRGESMTSHAEANVGDKLDSNVAHKNNELSEKELQIKTKKEIVALSVQLGKMNIAAWASKAEEAVDQDQLKKVEFGNRAAAWEEAEKSKHAARFKREEIKIQALESYERSKVEAKLRKLEAQVEQMKAQAQDKMMKKLAVTKQRSEEKRAIAEARKNRQAAKTAQQAEHIRETGCIPPSQFSFCNCFY